MEDTKVIDIETAQAEIVSWLDYKKVSQRKRETYEGSIELLTEAIRDGELVLNHDTHELTQELKFPVGDEKKITHLTFIPRLEVSKIQSALQGVSPKETDKRVLAYVSALTSQTKGVIGRLDSEDFGIGQCIAVFFI